MPFGGQVGGQVGGLSGQRSGFGRIAGDTQRPPERRKAPITGAFLQADDGIEPTTFCMASVLGCAPVRRHAGTPHVQAVPVTLASASVLNVPLNTALRGESGEVGWSSSSGSSPLSSYGKSGPLYPCLDKVHRVELTLCLSRMTNSLSRTTEEGECLKKKLLFIGALLAVGLLAVGIGYAAIRGGDKDEAANGNGGSGARSVDRVLMRNGEQPGFRPDGDALTVVGVNAIANHWRLAPAAAQQLRD